MEKDRFNGQVRILKDDHGGYGLDISGDINSYVVIDALSAVTKANESQRQSIINSQRLDFLLKAGTTFMTLISAIAMIGFLFGGCQPKRPAYVHPTQHYPGNW